MPSPAYPTLPTGPLGHIALDHERLRAEGLRLLGRLAGEQWTDFNPTDPGITILEQLCYAITDLAYRTDHPIPDLLAGTDLAVALPGPAAILTCDPVTPEDLRKLVLDVDGVRSAVFEPLGEPELPVYYHPGSNELRLVPDPSEPDVRPIALLGLARLALQTESLDSSDLVLARAAAQVHAHRGLGEDVTLEPLGTQQVWVQARIEVAPTDDPAALQAEILERLEAHLAPAVHFTALADATAAGAPLDALYDGPALRHGFIREDLPATRRSIRTSDLLHVITDLPAVRAVRSIALATARDGQRERWVLPLPAGQVAVLSADSEITLLRGGLPLQVDPVRVRALLDERRLAARARSRAAVQDPPTPVPGRDRKLARYRSIQHDFPAVYGIGALGLPGPASATRQAQARQLEAYLLIFDQLLANQFAQLAHARELLSPDVGSTPTYHAQPVVDPSLRLPALLRKKPGEQPAWLAELIERVSAGDDPHGRRKRFLAHLLARHAEQIGDYAQIGGASEGDGLALVEDREAFLRDIPRLGSARGSGRDLLGDGDAPSGLEQRLRLKLGLRGGARFHLVEHILLRPLPEDARQLGDDSLPQVPLFADVAGRDPWSLQVSFVFEAREGGAPDDAFERMVADAILAETPAHLRPHLQWLDAAGPDTFAAFDAAWSEFRAAHRAYRRERMRGTQMPDELHLVLRDARDRVVDLLGLGRSYPLRDLPVPRTMMVPPFHAAVIPIQFTQRGVVYVLCDEASGKPIVRDGKPIELAGTGGTISLTTPIIDNDKLYRILAVKIADRDTEHHREAWLHATVRVEKGVDPTLVARIIGQPLLIPSDNDQPPPDAARIADYNTIVQVEVLASQEGVFYDLVNDANPAQVVSQGTPVASPGGTIVLKTRAVLEDFDLRVRGVRPGVDGQAEGTRTALLTLVLPLRVRANPALTAEILGGPIVDHANIPTPRSLWAAGATPQETIAAPAPIELGLKFRADVAGQITGIRFYKGAPTLGTHVVNLWRADGTSLATATLPIPDASAAPVGWQQVDFAAPVPIAADTTYVASYFAPSGGWSQTTDLLAGAAIDRAPLHALRSGVDGPNAVARPGPASAFPSAPLGTGSSYDWLDLVFTPTPAAPTLRLLKSQASVEYRVYRRRVRDGEFVLGAVAPAPTLDVVDAGRTIRVLRPAGPVDWADLVPVGEARRGNGGALELPLGAFTDDAYVFIQASKHHRIGPQDPGPIDSAVLLDHIQPILVRPDAQASPSLTVPVVGLATAGPITVQNGQPGVYLELRAAGRPIGRPAYFHQRDDLAPTLNKGVGGLVIETDLAIARSHDDPPGLDKLAPRPPQVDTTPLPLPTVVHVVARKAFNGLTAELARLARLTPALAIQAVAPIVPPGGATQIRVTASTPGATYQLLRDGELVATGNGNGGLLELPTGPLDAKTTFEVVGFRDDPATLRVECRAAITVDVA